MLLRIALYLIVTYIALTVFVFFVQRRLLYHPSQGNLSQDLIRAQGLKTWPESGEGYRGFISANRDDYPNGTVVVFHGNAGAASDRSYYTTALGQLGYRVLLAEYPGYGARIGKPSETAFVEDAKTTIKLAHQTFGAPIFLWGESLGSGVVAAVASDPTLPVAAVVLLTPWDSLANLAQTIYWFLPARWLVLDRYDSVKNLQSFHGRIAIVVAAQDEVIPVQHGLALYASIQGPKRLWRFEQAGHNSWPNAPGASWWKEVMDYISEK